MQQHLRQLEVHGGHVICFHHPGGALPVAQRGARHIERYLQMELTGLNEG